MKKFMFVVKVYTNEGEYASTLHRCISANSLDEAYKLFSSNFKNRNYKIVRAFVEVWNEGQSNNE